MAEGTETGEIVNEGDHATLVFRLKLDHPPAAVWKALTDPEHLAKWYMAEAVLDARPGGHVDLHAGVSRFHVTGKILLWEPPRVFEHEWKVAPRPEMPQGEDAVIRWELEPEDGGTVLRLTHRGLHRLTATGFAPGTHAFLDRLTAHLAGRPLPGWQQRFQEVAPGYPPMWK